MRARPRWGGGRGPNLQMPRMRRAPQPLLQQARRGRWRRQRARCVSASHTHGLWFCSQSVSTWIHLPNCMLPNAPPFSCRLFFFFFHDATVYVHSPPRLTTPNSSRTCHTVYLSLSSRPFAHPYLTSRRGILRQNVAGLSETPSCATSHAPVRGLQASLSAHRRGLIYGRIDYMAFECRRAQRTTLRLERQLRGSSVDVSRFKFKHYK